MKRRRRWWLAGAAGVAAAVSLLMIPAFGEGPIVAETGVLHLQMDSVNGDKFRFEGGEVIEQPLNASNCKLGTAAITGPLVNLAAAGSKNPFPGLKDHRLGVGQTGEGTGEKCGQINKDKNQSLTLSLTGKLQGKSIGYAELNLEFKFNGDAILQTKLAGAVKDTIEVDCNSASDCGPDSGGSDNKLVILSTDPLISPDVPVITSVFDTIVITPGNDSPNGAISLEGDTQFRLVGEFDGEIACEDPATVLEGEAVTFSVTRGNDTDGNCKGFNAKLLYNFDSGIDGTELFVDFFTEPVDPETSTVAQFLEVIEWEFGGPPAAPPQHRILSYDDPPFDTDVDPGKRPMPWCEKDPRVDGGLPGPTEETPVVDPYDYLPGLPGDHTSCLIDVHSYVTPNGKFITVHTIYNIGDGKRWT